MIFKPVVESVVHAGTYVEVVYRKKTGSKDLGREADKVRLLDIQQLADWAALDQGEDGEDHFPSSRHHTFPGGDAHDHLPAGPDALQKEGAVPDGKLTYPVKLSFDQRRNTYIVTLIRSKMSFSNYFFKDLSRLESFVAEQYGEIVWR